MICLNALCLFEVWLWRVVRVGEHDKVLYKPKGGMMKNENGFIKHYQF